MYLYNPRVTLCWLGLLEKSVLKEELHNNTRLMILSLSLFSHHAVVQFQVTDRRSLDQRLGICVHVQMNGVSCDESLSLGASATIHWHVSLSLSVVITQVGAATSPTGHETVNPCPETASQLTTVEPVWVKMGGLHFLFDSDDVYFNKIKLFLFWWKSLVGNVKSSCCSVIDWFRLAQEAFVVLSWLTVILSVCGINLYLC